MENLKPSKKSIKPTSLIIVMIFIVFAFLLFYLRQTGRPTPKPIANVKVVPSPIRIKSGLLAFKQVPVGIIVDKTNAFNLDIVASSDQRSIVSYDVIVTFKQGTVDIKSATSLLEDFELYTIKKNDHFIITGVKKLTSTTPSVFSGSPIIRLNVVALETGDPDFKVEDNLGLEKSQFVDEKTKILEPEVGGVSLNIK